MATPRNSKRSPKKPRRPGSTVRHTRAIQRDRTQRPLAAPITGQVEQRLTDIIHPATLAQLDYFRALGLRQRLLTLPVMVALVVVMIWRQIPSVCELVRLLAAEGFLWISPVTVSQQALSQRLRVFPATLFQQVFLAVLPAMQARWEQRTRPLPAPIAWAKQRYSAVLAADGSTLDVLVRKVGLLQDLPKPPLAGRILALLDVGSRLPRQIEYTDQATAHDQSFWPALLAAAPAGALLLLDAGFVNFACYRKLTLATVTFIVRAKSKLAHQVVRVNTQTPAVHDTLVWIGRGADRQQVRLVEVLVGRTWYRFLTNELSPGRLPVEQIAALYAQRWRIEDAFAIVKRLLGLAYFWVGAINAIQLQVWATWLLYAVLVDLADAIAEGLRQPLADLSLVMVYRSLYYATGAYHRGETNDVVAYLVSKAQLFGIIKRKRKKKPPADDPSAPT